MKKIVASIMAISFCVAFNVQALSIDVIPTQQHINIGENVELQVRVSGLQDGNAPSLGDYDLNLNYNANLFQFSSISWGDSNKGNQLDLNGYGSLQDISLSTGLLRMLEISFDDANILNTQQADEFSLFRILFKNIAFGSADFSVSVNTIGDSFGNALSVSTLNNTHVFIAPVNVPEPSSVLLLLGLIAIPVVRQLRLH